MYLFPVIIYFPPLQHWKIFVYLKNMCSSFPFFLFFHFLLRFMQIQEWCHSLSCMCAVLLWAFPPVFSLSVCWSLCQTSVIPQTLITPALWGDTPPLFYSAPADRGLHVGLTAWFRLPAATVANMVLQHFRVHLLHISTYSIPSTIGHLLYFI